MSLFNAKKQEDKKGALVFLIEDNQMYAKAMQHYLQTHLPQGSEVRIFPVGETALMSLNHHPDFIILDYFLDTRWTDASNGVEVAREIRKADPKVQIVVLSAQHEIKVVLEAVKVSGCTYFEKNDQSYEQVLAHIKKTLGVL